jgi:hypothetical protein
MEDERFLPKNAQWPCENKASGSQALMPSRGGGVSTNIDKA